MIIVLKVNINRTEFVLFFAERRSEQILSLFGAGINIKM